MIEDDENTGWKPVETLDDEPDDVAGIKDIFQEDTSDYAPAGSQTVYAGDQDDGLGGYYGGGASYSYGGGYGYSTGYGGGGGGISGGYSGGYNNAYTSSYSTYYGKGALVGAGRSASGFAGLSNQGATCYMNSILQTLFMTPEFRRMLYKWQYDADKHPEKSKCIPLQLQMLFGRLQLSEDRAVETTALTESFGWTSGEVFQQHDVQELVHLLFDALENAFRGTPTEGVLRRLYYGRFTDLIECKPNGHSRTRDDEYSDISLNVDGGCNNLFKGFEKFIELETMEGDDQWNCEQCGEKADATKGLRINVVPYFLTIQLKRFGYDPKTYYRIKITDECAFPAFLDMAQFMNRSAAPGTAGSPGGGAEMEVEAADSPGSGLEDDGWDIVPADPSSPASGDARFDLETERPVELTGGHVYELFSILVHSGSALGGHYYAYIKDLSKRKWFCFNDSSVEEVDAARLRKAFGGSRNYASAYLLVYRKVDGVENQASPDDSEVPAYIRDAIDAENEESKIAAAKAKEERAKVSIDVYSSKGKKWSTRFNKNLTLQELVDAACEHFGEQYRSTYQGVPKAVISSELFSDTLKGQRMTYATYLFLEFRDGDSEPFVDYDADKLPVTIRIAGAEDTTMWYLSRSILVSELRARAAAALGCEADCARLLKETTWAMTEILSDSATLFNYHAAEGDTIIIEQCEPGEQPPTLVAYEEAKNVLTLKYDCDVEPSSDVEAESDSDGEESPEAESQSPASSTSALAVAGDDVVVTPTAEEKAAAEAAAAAEDARLSTVRFDKRRPLGELKELLSGKIGLRPSEFRIYTKSQYSTYGTRRTEHDATETLTYAKCDSRIFLKRGVPKGSVRTELRIALSTPRKRHKGLRRIARLLVPRSIFVSEIAHAAAELLGTPVSHVRLREYSTKAGRVLAHGRTLGSQITSIYNDRVVFVEALPAPDTFTESDVIFASRLYRPETLGFDPDSRDHIVPKTTTVAQLREVLSAEYGIPVEETEFARIYSTDSYSMRSALWFRETYNDLPLSDPRVFISDATLVAVKDGRVADGIAKPEARPAWQGTTSTTTYSYPRYARAKEKGLQIYTKDDQQSASSASRSPSEAGSAAVPTPTPDDTARADSNLASAPPEGGLEASAPETGAKADAANTGASGAAAGPDANRDDAFLT